MKGASESRSFYFKGCVIFFFLFQIAIARKEKKLINIKNSVSLKKHISKTTLLILAAGQSFNQSFAYMIVWDLVFMTIWAARGITITEFLISIAAMDICIFMIGIHSSFPQKCAWNNIRVMRALLKDKELNRQLNGKTLIYYNGAWECSDAAWFVRINMNSACILFAPAINFSTAGIHTKHTVYDDFRMKRTNAKAQELDRYTFQTHHGTNVTIQVDESRFLLKWVAEHSGRTVMK